MKRADPLRLVTINCCYGRGIFLPKIFATKTENELTLPEIVKTL